MAFGIEEVGRVGSGHSDATFLRGLHFIISQFSGTDDADAVIAKMRELPVDDGFAINGRLREDGQMVHDMFLIKVKKPADSKGKGDFTQILRAVPGEQAFQTAAQSECPTFRK